MKNWIMSQYNLFTIKAFLTLLRAGLWENDVEFSQYNSIKFNEIYRLSQEQTVIGLIAAGFEHVIDYKIPKDVALIFAGVTIQLEQRNNTMNKFIGELVGKMENSAISTLLVKGQGIAQCYERPLWRTSGDVDLFMDKDTYYKAQKFYSKFAKMGDENPYNLHQEMIIDSWCVELHGTMRGGLFKHVDRVIDEVQNDTFNNNRIRIWNNNGIEIKLPATNNDILFIFTHIVQHFYKGGIGIRQVCD